MLLPRSLSLLTQQNPAKTYNKSDVLNVLRRVAWLCASASLQSPPQR